MITANTPIQYIPGIGRRTARILHQLGVHNIQKFEEIPTNVLVEIFGPSIRSVVERAHIQTMMTTDDIASHRLSPFHTHSSFSSMTLS